MIRYLDGFDHYVTADLTDGWTQVHGDTDGINVSAGNGRRASSCLRLSQRKCGVNLVVATSSTTCIAGFAFKPQGAFGLLQGYTADTNYQVYPGATGSSNFIPISVLCAVRQGGLTQIAIVANSNGTLSAVRPDGTLGPSSINPDRVEAILGTTSNALLEHAWQYVEVKVVIHGSTGSVTIKVNGDTWLSLTNIQTQATDTTAWDEFVLGGHAEVGGAADIIWDFDDFYLADADASNVNNTTVDFLGDIALTWRSPTADGAMTDFDPSTGVTRYPNVDDSAPDDDSTYNSTSVAGEIDTFAMQDAPVTGVGVVAVAVVHSARRTTSGATSTAGVVRISGNNYVGSAVGNTTTYSYNQYITTVKPSNQVAYSESDFNSLEVGYKKVV